MCGKLGAIVRDTFLLGPLYAGYKANEKDNNNKTYKKAQAIVTAENNRIQATARANALAKQPIQTVFAGGQQQAGGLFVQ